MNVLNISNETYKREAIYLCVVKTREKRIPGRVVNTEALRQKEHFVWAVISEVRTCKWRWQKLTDELEKGGRHQRQGWLWSILLQVQWKAITFLNKRPETF